MKKTILAVSAVALMGIAPAALAQSATSNLAVSASVAANCTITTAPVAFGSYDPLGGGPLNRNGSVTITCTKGSAPNVTLGLGSNASGSTRRMKGALATPDYLTYELYQPPSTTPGDACVYPGTTVWGTSGANIFTPAVAPSKAPRQYNVCGTVAGGQDVQVDSYGDTVLATVNF